MGVGDELIVSLMVLMYYQLSIRQSIDQRFLNSFLHIFKDQVDPNLLSLPLLVNENLNANESLMVILPPAALETRRLPSFSSLSRFE